MPNFITIHTRWRVINSEWRCIEESITWQDGTICPSVLAGMPCLSEYLLDYGFKIPDSISYCLAENDGFYLKYRRYGGSINLFINPVHKREHKHKLK